MVIIGHRSSKSTLGANEIIIEILGSRYSFGRGPFGRILEWRGELQSKEWLQHRRRRLHRLCLYCSEVRWDPTGNSEAKIWLKSDLQQKVWWSRAFVIGSWISLMYFAYFWFVHEWGHSILNIPRDFILSRKNAGLVGSRLGTRRSRGAVLWELVLLQLRLRPELGSTEAALEALPGAAHLPLSRRSQHPAKE